MHQLDKNEKIALGIGLLFIYIFIFVLNYHQPSQLQSLASAVSDPYYQFTSKRANENVIFIAIDNKSVKKIGRWPWSREKLAKGLSKISNAKVVALDVVFSETTNLDADTKLSIQLSELNSVGGVFLDTQKETFSNQNISGPILNSAIGDIGRISWIESKSSEPNIDQINSAYSLIGALNTINDPDARLRKYPLAISYQGVLVPSIGIQILRFYLNSDPESSTSSNTIAIRGKSIKFDKHGLSRPILYPENGFQRISFADLYNESFDPKIFTDKIVIIGVTDAGITDIRSTPLGLYPGPLIHASFVSSVLDQSLLRDATIAEKSALIVLTILLSFSVIKFRKSIHRYFAYLIITSLYWGIGLILATKLNIWIEPAFQMISIFLTAIAIEITLLTHEQHQVTKIRIAFSSYLPPELVKKVSENPERLSLGGERREITVLFSDIRGFTSLSEKISPERLAEVMNIYFQPMTEAIFRNNGTLDKYIGDAVMAIFNAPLDLPNHALAACKAAIEMQQAHELINQDLAKIGLPPLKTGIGIHTGPAVVGNFGSSIRFNYTAIGDTVNLASRLESATKKIDANILISDSVYKKVESEIICTPLGQVAIPGKQEKQNLFRIDWQSKRILQ